MTKSVNVHSRVLDTYCYFCDLFPILFYFSEVSLLIALSETVYSVDMDIEQEFGIKADRSIVVLGVTHTDTDKDITETLEKYGIVAKVVRLSNTEEMDKCHAIVEFESATAVVKPKLPFDIQDINDTVVTWHVDSIKVLTQTVIDSGDSDGSSNTDSDHSTTPLIHRSRKKTDANKPSPHASTQVKMKPKSTAKGGVTPTSTDDLDEEVLNPPEVRRIVVERDKKNDAPKSQTESKRLRSFFGRVPKPPGEADFETWLLHVELMFCDNVSVEAQRRRILESLLPPASGSLAHRVIPETT